ncbi:MAG: MFS transporter [Candidatus Goldiibacteriota bacterium]
MTENRIHQKSILIISVISSFMATFMGSAVNVALPAMGREFNMDAVLMSWIATSFLLAAAVFSLPSGRIADIIGRKKTMLIGMMIFTFASVMTITAKSTEGLLWARVIQGLGGPMVFIASSAMLVEAFPKEKRGSVLGISVTAVYIGLSAGPFLGGVLTHNFGWRTIFVFSIPLGIAALLLMIFSLKGVNQAYKKGEKFDLAGFVIYAVSIISLMYGLTIIPEKTGFLSAGAGIAGIILFLFFESKIKFPVLNVKLFMENRIFLLSNTAVLIHYSATFGTVFFMSLYLQYAKGMTPQQAGAVIMIQPVLMALFSSYAGRLSDRVNPGKIASTGMGVTAAGLGAFVFVGLNTPVWVIGIILFFTGIGLAFFSSPNTNIIMSSVEKKDYAPASAVMGTMRLMGQTTGLALSAMVLSLIIGRSEITPDRLDDFIKVLKISFSIFAFLCVLGIFASLARLKPAGKYRADV